MNQNILNELEEGITRLQTEIAALASLFTNEQPLQPGVEVPMIPFPNIYRKVVELYDQINSLKSDFLKLTK